MAITHKYIEGFDDGIAYNLADGWNTYRTANGSNRYEITGRTGSALRMRGEGGGGASSYTIQYTNLGTLIGAGTRLLIGCAIRSTNLGLTNSQECPIAFSGTNSLGITFDANGKIQLRAGILGNSTLVTTSTDNVIAINVWYHIEMNILFGTGGTGNAEIKVNGTTVINSACTVSGLTTLLFGSNLAATTFVDIDDLYIATSDSSSDFLGDNRVYTLFPNGNGTTNQGTGSDGNSTDNYLLVDEAAVSTSDYVDVVPGGQRDLYTFQDLPFANGTINGVQQVISVERTDSGAADVKTLVKNGANEVIGTAQTPNFGSVVHIDGGVLTSKPGGGAWTVSDVNSTEFGIETA